MNIPEKALGFQTSLFTHFPLPRTNVGNEFSREVNHTKCSYWDPLGIPHTAVDRRWIEIITTLAKKSGDAWIELGAVSHALARYSKDATGGKTGNIQSARKAVYRFANLHVSTMRTGIKGGLEVHQALNFAVAEKAQVIWAKGRTDIVQPELFDNENYIELSKPFMELVKNAAPHDQAHYMQIQSPLELDLYQWLVTKLYTLKEDQLIKWASFYAQFGKTGGMLTENQMKDLRKNIKTCLLSIRKNYYPKAEMESTNEGILLKQSPPLIEPDHKRAGFILL